MPNVPSGHADEPAAVAPVLTALVFGIVWLVALWVAAKVGKR
jgi:hypothetical protein